MLLISDSQGNVTEMLPSKIYQGSNFANEIILLSPFGYWATVTVTLPNGIKRKELAMTSVFENIPRDYYAYRILFDKAITQYKGKLKLSFAISNFISDAKDNELIPSQQQTITLSEVCVNIDSSNVTLDTGKTEYTAEESRVAVAFTAAARDDIMAARDAAENARDAAKDAQKAAENARDAAKDARDDAVKEQVKAVNAQKAAENAQKAAENAQGEAERAAQNAAANAIATLHGSVMHDFYYDKNKHVLTIETVNPNSQNGQYKKITADISEVEDAIENRIMENINGLEEQLRMINEGGVE